MEGLSEQQLRDLRPQELVPGKYYRPRRRKHLSIEDQEQILNAHMIPWMTQKDIARQFRVTEQLVRDLVRECRHQPEKLQMAKERSANRRRLDEIIR